MKVGDLVKYRSYPTHTLGIVVDAAVTGSYVGVMWAVHPTAANNGATYPHRYDLELLEEDRKCPGEEHAIDYITNTTKES